MLTFMVALRMFWTVLSTSPAPVQVQQGLVGVYGYAGDRLAGGPLACTQKTLALHEAVCAHRTLPCGTTLLVQSLRTGRVASCKVLDRGPYGARLPSGRFVIKTSTHAKGQWRGVLDMSPAVAAKFGVSTSEPVRLIYFAPGSAAQSRALLRASKRRAPFRRPAS
jgi:hypothetical protein